MFQESALTWTFWIRLGAPAKRAVEKFPVSLFHLEMAASSTRAGELGLESQEEGLLAEKSEAPRFCSVYLQGTTSKCLLGFIILWVSGTSIIIYVLKLNWHIVLRCLPGCIFGFILVLMASYEVKHRESKHIETEKLPKWAVLALPHFLWLILLSVFEMTWQAFMLQVVGTALGCLGLCSWMAEADDSEEDDSHNRWRIAGRVLQITGLLVMWLGALPCLVQITWQVAVSSLPGICLFLYFAFRACTGGVPRDIDVMGFISSAPFPLYLMALPLSGMWQWFTGMELAAYSYLCILLCRWIWFQDLRVTDLVGFGVVTSVICAIPFGTFAWATKLSCNQVGPWCHCWPWVLFVPFALVSIYCAVEGFFLLWYRDKVRVSRAAMLTRIILIGTLALAAVLLATDVETWQEGVEAPSMNPMEYFDVTMENWTHPDIEVKRHQLHWLRMPQPIWPSSDDLANTSSRRTSFWLSYMSFKFVLAAAMVFLVLKCNWASSKQSQDGADSQDTMEVQPLTKLEEAQGESFDDRHRSAIFCAILPIYLTLVIKISCTAALFGQLTAETGLAFEGYDLCLTCGLLWLVVQALAMRASDFEAQYNATDILLSMSFLVPFVGDGFDSLKDSMLGALALRSQLVPLQCLGVFSPSYLVMFHIVLACNGSDRVQLEKAYLPVLFLKKQKPRNTTAEGSTPGFSCRKVLVLLYEQVKPSRQWAMLLEDLPQGMVALVVSSVEGFQGFTVIVNIGVPLFRISMAWLLHDWIASQLADWFLEEAMKALDAKQFAFCDDFIAALHQLQRTSSFKASDMTLWEHLTAKNETCCLEAVQKSQDEQSPVSLRLFVALQRVGIDNESAEDGWKKINELLKQCTLKQILDARSSIACAPSSPSELVLPPRFGFTKVMAILESIREPHKLTKLMVRLSEEKIGFSGAKVLGEQLSKFQQITTLKLDLRYNKLGPEAARALADHLSDLVHLTEVMLVLWGNDIGDEVRVEIRRRLQRPGRTVVVVVEKVEV